MSATVLHRVMPPWPALGRVAASRVVWCALTSIALLVSAAFGSGPSLSIWLGDTDDAVRLVTVRELIAGAPWFDTTLPRIGAPEPLLSHWSRLIDLPLASLMEALTPFLGPERAELAARLTWPVLLFFALQLIVVTEARRRAGLWAAVFALVLTFTSATALVQFRPGRIDHHNAQILCAVAGLLFLVRSLEDKRWGTPAGILLGLGLAVGYEAIALIVPAAGLAALAAVWQPRHGAGVARAALAATATLFAALILTVAPSRWLDIHCDALSLNLPVVGLCCSAGIWAAVASDAKPALRFAILGVPAAVGGLLYAALEPACLVGPFGQVNAALKPVWLDHVMETKSVLWFAAGEPALALSFIAFVLAGTAAQLTLWRKQPSPTSALSAAMVVLAVLLAFWQIKLISYASWLAALPLAVLAARLGPMGSLSAPIMRFGAVVLLNQAMLHGGFDAALSALRWTAGLPATAAQTAEVREACVKAPAMRPLDALPSGLVAANIDLGPHIVAWSHHRVVAAPYHRLDKGILANEAILNGKPDRALRELKTLGVDYIALCADGFDAKLQVSADKAEALRRRLLKDEKFGFLQELTAQPASPIRFWRVLR